MVLLDSAYISASAKWVKNKRIRQELLLRSFVFNFLLFCSARFV